MGVLLVCSSILLVMSYFFYILLSCDVFMVKRYFLYVLDKYFYDIVVHYYIVESVLLVACLDALFIVAFKIN